TLSSRAPYAKALLEAVAGKQVPVADLSADGVRQIRSFENADLDKLVADLWGTVRETPEDRKRAMQQYRRMLTRRTLVPPDLAHGRMLFVKTCGQCHKLFAVGGEIGPDITGSNRTNLD